MWRVGSATFGEVAREEQATDNLREKVVAVGPGRAGAKHYLRREPATEALTRPSLAEL